MCSNGAPKEIQFCLQLNSNFKSNLFFLRYLTYLKGSNKIGLTDRTPAFSIPRTLINQLLKRQSEDRINRQQLDRSLSQKTARKNVIKIRNGVDSDNVSTLVFQPVAVAKAGLNGKAISTPISRAVLRKGVNADIIFEPETIAIAGPGGIAHAESVLEIYEEVI